MTYSKYGLGILFSIISLSVMGAKTTNNTVVGTPSVGTQNNMTYPGQNLPTNNAFQGPASNPYNQNQGRVSPAQQAVITVNPLNNTYTCQMAGTFPGPNGRTYQCPGAGTFTIPAK
jgi:hypothetical protein